MKLKLKPISSRKTNAKKIECENENEIDNKLTIKNIIKQSDNQAPEDQEIGIMYVTNTITGTVSVIDTATNTVFGLPIPVGNFPQGIAFALIPSA